MVNAYFGGKIIGGFILAILTLLALTAAFAVLVVVGCSKLAWKGWLWARR